MKSNQWKQNTDFAYNFNACDLVETIQSEWEIHVEVESNKPIKKQNWFGLF